MEIGNLDLMKLGVYWGVTDGFPYLPELWRPWFADLHDRILAVDPNAANSTRALGLFYPSDLPSGLILPTNMVVFILSTDGGHFAVYMSSDLSTLYALHRLPALTSECAMSSLRQFLTFYHNYMPWDHGYFIRFSKADLFRSKGFRLYLDSISGSRLTFGLGLDGIHLSGISKHLRSTFISRPTDTFDYLFKLYPIVVDGASGDANPKF